MAARTSAGKVGVTVRRKEPAPPRMASDTGFSMAPRSGHRLVRLGAAAASVSALLAATGSARGQQASDAVRPEAPSVLVHIDAPHEVLLEAAEQGSSWLPRCLSPCDMELPPTASYRLRASGIKTSAPFSLVAPAGEVETVRVHEANPGLFVTGIVAIAAAPAVAALGLAPPSGLPDGLSSLTSGEVLAGALVLATAVLVTGIVLVVTNASTSVSQHVGSRQSSVSLAYPAILREGSAAPGLQGGVTLLSW